MKLVSQLGIILSIYFIGELIVRLLGIKFPGSILGMILLLLALEFKVIKVEWIKEVATFFLNNMMLLFIPLGVGLMDQWGIISKQWLPILVSTFLSTFIVMSVVGLIINKKKK